MDLDTDKVIHVSYQTELNPTAPKIFPDFRNSWIRVGSGLQGKLSAQPNLAPIWPILWVQEGQFYSIYLYDIVIDSPIYCHYGYRAIKTSFFITGHNNKKISFFVRAKRLTLFIDIPIYCHHGYRAIKTSFLWQVTTIKKLTSLWEQNVWL